MKKTFAFLAAAYSLASISSATTIAHWQFNDLNDTTGIHHLTNTNGSDTTVSGGNATFTGSGSGLLSAPDHGAWDDDSFTVESIFTFTTPIDSRISTIAAHLSTAGGRQWLVGTNTDNIPFLLARGSGASSETSFVSSYGALVSGRTYYLGVAVDFSAVDPASRVTLYFRDITADGAFLTDNSSTSITALQGSSAPLSIGSTGHLSSRFTGSIDEIRFSDTKLGPNDLLIAPIPEPSAALLSLFTVSLLGLRRKRA